MRVFGQLDCPNERNHRQGNRWNEEVVRIVKASKSTQKRMDEWSPELMRHRSPW